MKKLILSVILHCIGALSYAQAPTLFEYSSLTPQLSEDQQAFVNRIILKYEALNTSFITVSNIETIQQNGILSFALPSGEKLVAHVLRVNKGEENTFVWTGKIGENGDFISLAHNEGGTGGMIKYQNRFYSIHTLDSENTLLVESDLSVHEEIICGMGAQLGTTAFAEEECIETECDGPIIDVLLVWTDEASQWLLGLGNPFVIAIYGMLGIESINIAFANSGISGEVRYQSFRYSGFSYDAQNEIADDVITLTNDPIILAARDEARADLVIMFTNQTYINPVSGSQTFGRVNAIGPGSDNAFAIVEIPFLISPRWTLAHETGHLFGARHNRVSNGGNDDTDICSHAWRFTGSSGNENRTILALLASNTGERILHYSNPDVSFSGAATGTDDNDNAGRIDHTKCEVSDYLEPLEFNVTISGSSKLCRCFPEQYEEFRNYRANVDAPLPPLSGVPPYEYVWHWNTSGIFTQSNPGNFIGDTETININFNIPCDQFFLQLIVTSSDGIIKSHIRAINTEECADCTSTPCFVGNNTEDREQNHTSNLAEHGITSFSMIPNPAHEKVSFLFSLTKEEQVSIQLTDVSGKIVYERPQSVFSKGQHSYHLPLHDIPSGLYFCTFECGKSRKTTKLVIE